jgi:hypothetical protein
MLNIFTKRSSGSDNLLLFLIAAAFSVLATRMFLYLMDYPQIGRGEIHLAHALAGLILMTVANMALFSYHGKIVRQFGAVVGGLGFGQIIDEIGKLITRDNNYFYQPVPMIIYLIFVSLFFLYRYLDQYAPHSPKEIFYDSLERLEELAEDSFRLSTQKWIENMVEKITSARKQNYQLFADHILQIAQTAQVKPRPVNGYVQKIKSSWHWLDDFTAERRPVFYFLLIVFLIYIVVTFWGAATFTHLIWLRQFEHLKYEVDTRFDFFLIIAQYVSQFVSALLMIRGFLYLVRRKRIRALQFFRNGLAVNILITQIATFYFKQFAAVPELLAMVLMFAVVHNILEEANS